MRPMRDIREQILSEVLARAARWPAVVLGHEPAVVSGVTSSPSNDELDRAVEQLARSLSCGPPQAPLLRAMRVSLRRLRDCAGTPGRLADSTFLAMNFQGLLVQLEAECREAQGLW